MTPSSRSEPPRAYVIDVCRTCGAHASWPFSCGHKPEGWVPGDAERWTVPLIVRPSSADREKLTRSMQTAATLGRLRR